MSTFMPAIDTPTLAFLGDITNRTSNLPVAKQIAGYEPIWPLYYHRFVFSPLNGISPTQVQTNPNLLNYLCAACLR